MRSTLLTIFITLFCFGCGDSTTVSLQVNFSNGTGVTQSSDPFRDGAVRDVIFVLTSVAPAANVVDPFGNTIIDAGTILDDNGDGIADATIFPSTCTSLSSLACGFLPTDSDFNLAGIRLNYRYTLQVLFRNATGTTLYQGASAAFDNTSFNTSNITLQVNRVP